MNTGGGNPAPLGTKKMRRNKKINSRGWSPFFKSGSSAKIRRIKVGDFRVYAKVQNYEFNEIKN